MKNLKTNNMLKIIFKLRGYLMIPPVIFVILCTWGEIEKDWLVFGLGGAIFALGFALRVWAQMHIHYRLKTKKMLTTTGPYAYTRNPLYIANTVMLAAVCMLSELFWFAPIQILYCAAVYSFVVRFEEEHLTQKYGTAYLNYVNEVPRWFPRLRQLNINKTNINTNKYFTPSIAAEIYNLLLLLPFVIKEILF